MSPAISPRSFHPSHLRPPPLSLIINENGQGKYYYCNESFIQKWKSQVLVNKRSQLELDKYLMMNVSCWIRNNLVDVISFHWWERQAFDLVFLEIRVSGLDDYSGWCKRVVTYRGQIGGYPGFVMATATGTHFWAVNRWLISTNFSSVF